MLRYALLAIMVAVAISAAVVLLPIHRGQRPEPRILATGDAASTDFVIHPAGPAAPVVPGTPGAPATPSASPGDLDAVMQRLRAGGAKPDAIPPATTPVAPTVPAVATPAGPPAAQFQTTQATPPPSPPAVPPGLAPTDLAAPSPRWSSITAQGTRWRMARGGSGYVLSLDLGGGQTADVHVQAAFANLDTASVNVRVDYLRDTIVQNFSRQSGSYIFARDGSVSIDR